MKNVYRVLFALHAFVGIGAVAGGLGAVTNPRNPMGVPVELLRNSPFEDYLIPGIILLTVLGFGNILSAYTLYRRCLYQGYISSIFSWALVFWIVVQCIMLDTIAFLHVLYFIIGLVQAALSAVILFRQGLFPANILLRLYKDITKDT